MQGNRKTDEGGNHADRDEQFNFINDKANEFLAFGDPVISVNCKKKELIGNFKNEGEEWLPQGNPTEVKVYDFIDKEAGKAIPYGVYDIANNEGWVSVGISHDTACFAVATIRSWWNEIGKNKFEKSKKILITADGGGSALRLLMASIEGIWSKYPFWLKVILCPLIRWKNKSNCPIESKFMDEQRAKLAMIERESVK